MKSTAHFKLDQQMTIDLSCVLYIIRQGIIDYLYIPSFLQIYVLVALYFLKFCLGHHFQNPTEEVLALYIFITICPFDHRLYYSRANSSVFTWCQVQGFKEICLTSRRELCFTSSKNCNTKISITNFCAPNEPSYGLDVK